jgi:hypothetical protein
VSDPRERLQAETELATVRLGCGFTLAAVAQRPVDLALVLATMGDVLGHECVAMTPTTRCLALIAHSTMAERSTLTEHACQHYALPMHAARALALAPESDC